MEKWLARESLLIGEENIKKLNSSTVAIFGCGGVGSYAVEALARAGIGKIVLIDSDIVDETNINRQLIADTSTIGKNKVDVEKERILRINPKAEVITYNTFFNEESSKELINKEYNYIIDAIDSVKSKILLIQLAYEKKINIISAMGMGNKLDPTMIEVSDISKTEVCPLAKTIRKQLRQIGINHTKVVYSKENPIKIERENKVTASISFVPSVCGLIMAGEVIKDIIKK